MVAALTTLGGCSAMLLGTGDSGSAPIGSESRSSAQIEADNALGHAVADAFRAEPGLASLNIGISAKSGVVTLEGKVDSFELRDQAIAVAGGIVGVSRVNNHLQVRTKG